MSAIRSWISTSLGERGYKSVMLWRYFALFSAALFIAIAIVIRLVGSVPKNKTLTYDDLAERAGTSQNTAPTIGKILSVIVLIITVFFTLIYLGWRIVFSIPVESGIIAVAANILLLIVEVFGFIESLILFYSLLRKKHHPLPQIPEEAWPDVDIFVFTYNEPTDLLKRTINGCIHMKYPDPS